MWATSATSAVAAAGLGVVINYATDKDSSWLAWALVGTFTLATTCTSAGAHLFVNARRPASESSSEEAEGLPQQKTSMDVKIDGKNSNSNAVQAGGAVHIGDVKNSGTNGWQVALALGVGVTVMIASVVAYSVATSASMNIQHQSAVRPEDSGLVTAPQSGELLIASVSRIDSVTPYWASVFPIGEDKFNDFRDKVQVNSATTGSDTLLAALNHGAFALGGVKVVLTLEGNSDRKVTINNIRPVEISHGDPVLGNVVQGPTSGNGNPRPERLGYVLDADSPQALSIDEKETLQGLYFDDNSISLPGKDKQQFTLYLKAEQRSAEFAIEVDFEVAGQEFSTLALDSERKGTLHLRATPDLCPQQRLVNPKVPTRPMLEGKAFSGLFHFDQDSGMLKRSSSVEPVTCT